MATPEYATDLRRTVDAAVPRLRTLPPESVRAPLAPGKWSPAEVIGHLVDSASNNHGRFVRAGLGDGLRMQGYAQEEWVRLQNHANADWDDLVTLWHQFNRHIAGLMEAIPEDVRLAETTDHDLDRLAWEVVETGRPTTLDYFMRDYVGHLKHHLRQIDPTLADEPLMQNPNSRIKRT